MTMQQKLMSLNGKEVTVRDHFCGDLSIHTGISRMTTTEDPPGGVYISVDGYLGAFVADHTTAIWELKDGIIISIGIR